MSKFLPRYQELYVVSDIHMGGEKTAASDFQIFNRGERLANLVLHVAEQRPQDEVALVLNGDIIDALAEDSVPGYVALDADTALAMMERIYADPSFSPVWDALAKLVQTPRRHLVFVVGNHDIELALPPVEASVRDRLARGDPAANARIVFATHGGGFGCYVGRDRVFCTHGNEVDGWNFVDYSALGGLGNAMNAGRRPDASRWMPNPGTRLVVDVMNDVKRRHPFVDLLKPEVSPVVAVLLTLDPGAVKRIDLGDAYAIVRDKVRGDLETRNLLSAGEPLSHASPDALAVSAAQELLGASLGEEVGRVRSAAAGADEETLLLEAERAVAERKPASDAIDAGDTATLGWGDIVSGWIGRIDKVEALRRALSDWLEKDTTYDVDARDSTFDEITRRVGPEVGFVVTGHTHLARAIEFAPKRHYYNCGTWIRLLRLTPEVLADAKAFEQHAYPALAAGRMDALDGARIPGPGGQNVPLVLDRANVVRISENAGAVTGSLLRVGDGAKPGSVKLLPETGGLGT